MSDRDHWYCNSNWNESIATHFAPSFDALVEKHNIFGFRLII
jgi:hypothetical protein